MTRDSKKNPSSPPAPAAESGAPAEDIRMLNRENATFFASDTGVLRMTLHGHYSLLRAEVRRLFPVNNPNRYIAVRNDNENEIGLIERLHDLDSASRHAVEEELDLHYGIPGILEIRSINEEHGYWHWDTVTDRGERSFVVKGRTTNVTRAGATRYFVEDIRRCRYEIPDADALPAASRTLLERVL